MILKMELGPSSYDIVVERGSLGKLKTYLELQRKVLVVTDDGIPEKYVKSVLSQCNDAVLLTFPHGDKSKSLANYEKILSTLVDNSFSRSDVVIALGGGMVSDLAGFAASSYMRGMDFYIIPTTLLSQVDASIGGKVAVNFKGYKNLVGAFYQPKKVVIDLDTLKTLDERLFNEGLAEAIKVGTTNNLSLFELIEKSENIHEDIDKIVTMSLMIKKSIVEKDEKESWLRQTLNYGHTVGHAIESLSEGKLYHGECVSIGMLYLISDDSRDRLKEVLIKYKLPTTDQFASEDLIQVITHDKKAKDETVTVCYVEEIGKNKLKRLSVSELKKLIEEYKKIWKTY